MTVLRVPRHPDNHDPGDEDPMAWVGVCPHGVRTEYVSLDGRPVCPQCYSRQSYAVGRVVVFCDPPHIPLQETRVTDS